MPISIPFPVLRAIMGDDSARLVRNAMGAYSAGSQIYKSGKKFHKFFTQKRSGRPLETYLKKRGRVGPYYEKRMVNAVSRRRGFGGTRRRGYKSTYRGRGMRRKRQRVYKKTYKKKKYGRSRRKGWYGGKRSRHRNDYTIHGRVY